MKIGGTINLRSILDYVILELPYLRMKVRRDQGKNPKKDRHMPKKNNVQGGHEKSRIKALEKENQILR